MDIGILSLVVVETSSIVFLLLLLLRLRHQSTAELSRSQVQIDSLNKQIEALKKQTSSDEFKAFLSDVNQGGGLLEVRRVNPAHVFLHSPAGVE